MLRKTLPNYWSFFKNNNPRPMHLCKHRLKNKLKRPNKQGKSCNKPDFSVTFYINLIILIYPIQVKILHFMYRSVLYYSLTDYT